MILPCILLAVSLSIPVHLPVMCPGIPVEPIDEREASSYEYNSVLGLLTLVWELPEGVTLTTERYVLTVEHEFSDDEGIRVAVHPFRYTVRGASGKQVWVDMGGQGRCEDLRQVKD